MTEPEPPASFNVLCLGDSLTEGYTWHGTKFCPYTKTLTSLLTSTLTNETIEVCNEGVSGDKVTGPFMKQRLQHAILAAQIAGFQYDWIIILAGINDMWFSNGAITEIYAKLNELQTIAADNGKKVLVMNLMEIAQDKKDAKFRQRIDEFNRAVEWGVTEGGRENVWFLDIRKALPQHSLKEKERKELWDDDVHLTCKGYVKMGTIIFDRIKAIGLGGQSS
ncbi:hypothetical protein HDV00_012263 [Rhizophlyctis rosea]|nr:hypothetical protein HDV00_012263 [Rhizophlyctis rosea]